MNDYLVLGMVMLVLALSLVQAFQISALSATGSVIAASGGEAGESYEEMTARMHPDQVQPSSSPAMVGGC